MTRRLFDDLVVSGSQGARPPYLRTVPLSLAVHGTALLALAAISARAVREDRGRAGPLVFASSGPPHASVPAGTPRHRVVSPARRLETRPALVDPIDATPPVLAVSDGPLVETDLAGDLASDAPICPGCAVGDPGGTGLGSGSGDAGSDSGPPRPVGGNVREPRRIGGAVPVYPELARRAHVQGKVMLECVIDTDGRVTDLRVVSGHPLLTGAALDAVRGWTYTPTTLNGRPIRVILNVTVTFGLR